MRWISVVPLIAVFSATLHLARAQERPAPPDGAADPLAFEVGAASGYCQALASWQAKGMKGQAPQNAAACFKWLEVASTRYCASRAASLLPTLAKTFADLRKSENLRSTSDPDALRLILIGQGCYTNTEYELSKTVQRNPSAGVALALTAIGHDQPAVAAFYLRPLAADGNPIAQHNLGVLLSSGQGGIQDF